MLECVFIIVYVIIVIIRISEEIVCTGKDITCADISFGQEYLFRITCLKDFFRIIFQALAIFISQIGIDFPIAQNLHRILHPYRTMVGGNDDIAFFLCDIFPDIEQRRMFIPLKHQGTITLIIRCQLSDYLNLGTSMRQHIDKVINYDIEFVLHQVRHLLSEFLAGRQVQNFVV